MGTIDFFKKSPTVKYPKCSKRVKNPTLDYFCMPLRTIPSPKFLLPLCTFVEPKPTSMVLSSS